MTTRDNSHITPDPWYKLKSFTEARIALGRAGTSLPLTESLEFKLAHARARDAVQQSADLTELAAQLAGRGISTLLLQSSAIDRAEYLTRPDKGRRLATEAADILAQAPKYHDICLTVCDGLSAPAISENALEVITGLLAALKQTSLTIAPLCLVRNGRVAIGDHIAQALQCRMVIVLIGERPGLSSPNSLGAYITHSPSPGTTDEARNCISNIRAGGMNSDNAVQKIAYLIERGFQLGKTGVELKDKMEPGYLPFSGNSLELS